MTLFRKFLLIFPTIALILTQCGEPKPNFIKNEDYSYLMRANEILLVIRIQLDMINNVYDAEAEREIRPFLDENYQLGYRSQLAKEIYKLGSSNKLIIQFDQKADTDSNRYVKYIGRKYPKSIGRKKDLILEFDIRVFLSLDLSYVNVSKRETLRLLDAKTGHLYLSSHSKKTFTAIGKKIKLIRDGERFKILLQSIINRSTRKTAKYILNLERKPDEEDITPLMPKIKFRDAEDDSDI
ncbi:MAG: hypothetical protein IEMM0008_0551 [bacterium]|nr:MAG: hypothetical protein IEMM0008_0551 [bacterium]